MREIFLIKASKNGEERYFNEEQHPQHYWYRLIDDAQQYPSYDMAARALDENIRIYSKRVEGGYFFSIEKHFI